MYGVFFLLSRVLFYSKGSNCFLLLVILTIRQGEKQSFEAMLIKWIHQSRQTGRGPPFALTNVIGWPSADISLLICS